MNCYKKIVCLLLTAYLAVPHAIMGMVTQPLPPCFFNGVNLVRGDRLGEGTFGWVYKECDPGSGKYFACKYDNGSPTSKILLGREIAIMKQVKHPCIVTFKGEGSCDKRQVLVMEYVPGEDLFNWVNTCFLNSKLIICNDHQKQVGKFFMQLMLGLHYLHKKNIIHRDIKLENFLIGPHGMLKICDFGLAKKVANDELHNYGYFGPPKDFIAPEIKAGNPYNFKVDMWSAGVVLHDMLTRRAGNLDTSLPKECFQEFVDIRNMLLQQDPAKRPTAFEVLRMPIMKKYLSLVLEDVAKLEDSDLRAEWSSVLNELYGEIPGAKVCDATIPELETESCCERFCVLM